MNHFDPEKHVLSVPTGALTETKFEKLFEDAANLASRLSVDGVFIRIEVVGLGFSVRASVKIRDKILSNQKLVSFADVFRLAEINALAVSVQRVCDQLVAEVNQVAATT